MTYLQRSSVKKKNRKSLYFALSLVVGFLFIVFVFKKPLSNLVHYTVGPISQTKSVLLKPFNNLSVYYKSKKELISRNKELIEENKKLRFENLNTNSLIKENQELKEILDFEIDGHKPVIGEVIISPPYSPFDTFVIKIPNNFIQEGNIVNEKVSLNDMVFVDRVLAGKIIEVFKTTAKVKLFSSYKEFLPVKINNEILAQAEGMGGLSFKIQLPKDMEIKENDVIYPAQYSDRPIGLVDKIEINESSTFQTIYFNFLFDFSDFNFVQIIKSEI